MSLLRVASGRKKTLLWCIRGTAGGAHSLVMWRVSLQRYLKAGRRKLVALDDRVMHSITTAAHLDKKKLNTLFHDGKVDSAGRFFTGTIGVELPLALMERKPGSLYTLYPDRSSFRPSGRLYWSLDHCIFYHVESPTYMNTTSRLEAHEFLYRMV